MHLVYDLWELMSELWHIACVTYSILWHRSLLYNFCFIIITGGGASILEADISNRYHTHCDPRLNAEQALEIAFNVGDRLRQMRQMRK